MKKAGLLLLPLVFFLAATVFLLQGLYSDPRERESSLLNQPLPPFSLPDVMDTSVIYTQDLFNDQVSLINVWGTWCVTCAVEIPFLTELKNQGVRIVGLYYEQNVDADFGAKTVAEIQADIRQTLGQLGDPYALNIWDVKRDYSLDLGVTGAPETFLVDAEGTIRLHHIGDLNARVWQQKFAPLYQRLVAE